MFHLQNFSVPRDKAIWMEIVIPAHSLSQLFFDVRNQWNTKGFPYENFQLWTTSKFRRKLLITSPLFYLQSFWLPKAFGHTAQKGSSTKSFNLARQINFAGKSLFPRILLSLIFSIPEIIETLNDSPLKVLGNARQVNFHRKSWYPPLFFIYKLFCYRKCSETPHRNVPLRSFSILQDQKISEENRYSRPLFDPKLFSIPEIIKTLKDSPMKLFGTARQVNFDRKSWYS